MMKRFYVMAIALSLFAVAGRQVIAQPLAVEVRPVPQVVNVPVGTMFNVEIRARVTNAPNGINSEGARAVSFFVDFPEANATFIGGVLDEPADNSSDILQPWVNDPSFFLRVLPFVATSDPDGIPMNGDENDFVAAGVAVAPAVEVAPLLGFGFGEWKSLRMVNGAGSDTSGDGTDDADFLCVTFTFMADVATPPSGLPFAFSATDLVVTQAADNLGQGGCVCQALATPGESFIDGTWIFTGPANTPTPTPVGMPPTATPSPNATATPSANATATPSANATATPSANATPTPSPNATATPSANATATATNPATPTPSANATPSATNPATPTPSANATPSPNATVTASANSTATPSPSPTSTPLPDFFISYHPDPNTVGNVTVQDNNPPVAVQSYRIEIRDTEVTSNIVDLRVINSTGLNNTYTFTLPLRDANPTSYERMMMIRIRSADGAGFTGNQTGRSPYHYVQNPSSDPSGAIFPIGDPVPMGRNAFSFTDNRPTGKTPNIYNYDLFNDTEPASAETLLGFLSHTGSVKGVGVNPSEVISTTGYKVVGAGDFRATVRPQRNFRDSATGLIGRFLVGPETFVIYNVTPGPSPTP